MVIVTVFIPPDANAIIIKQQRIHSVTHMWATLTTGVLKQYSPTSTSMWHLQHLLLEVQSQEWRQSQPEEAQSQLQDCFDHTTWD